MTATSMQLFRASSNPGWSETDSEETTGPMRSSGHQWRSFIHLQDKYFSFSSDVIDDPRTETRIMGFQKLMSDAEDTSTPAATPQGPLGPQAWSSFEQPPTACMHATRSESVSTPKRSGSLGVDSRHHDSRCAHGRRLTGPSARVVSSQHAYWPGWSSFPSSS